MLAHGWEHPAALCCLGVIQVLGVISAFATRLEREASHSRTIEGVFLACLGLVALSTVLTLGARSGSWLVSAATFALMVLTALWDFGPKRDNDLVW